jgi:hypothetical protein
MLSLRLALSSPIQAWFEHPKLDAQMAVLRLGPAEVRTRIAFQRRGIGIQITTKIPILIPGTGQTPILHRHTTLHRSPDRGTVTEDQRTFEDVGAVAIRTVMDPKILETANASSTKT